MLNHEETLLAELVRATEEYVRTHADDGAGFTAKTKAVQKYRKAWAKAENAKIPFEKLQDVVGKTSDRIVRELEAEDEN